MVLPVSSAPMEDCTDCESMSQIGPLVKVLTVAVANTNVGSQSACVKKHAINDALMFMSEGSKEMICRKMSMSALLHSMHTCTGTKIKAKSFPDPPHRDRPLY